MHKPGIRAFPLRRAGFHTRLFPLGWHYPASGAPGHARPGLKPAGLHGSNPLKGVGKSREILEHTSTFLSRFPTGLNRLARLALAPGDHSQEPDMPGEIL